MRKPLAAMTIAAALAAPLAVAPPATATSRSMWLPDPPPSTLRPTIVANSTKSNTPAYVASAYPTHLPTILPWTSYVSWWQRAYGRGAYPFAGPGVPPGGTSRGTVAAIGIPSHTSAGACNTSLRMSGSLGGTWTYYQRGTVAWIPPGVKTVTVSTWCGPRR